VAPHAAGTGDERGDLFDAGDEATEKNALRAMRIEESENARLRAGCCWIAALSWPSSTS